MYLSDLKDHEKAILTKVNFHGIKKRRLYDLGFIPGELIERSFTSIFDSPICYKVKNTFIALRKKDACKIEATYE